MKQQRVPVVALLDELMADPELLSRWVARARHFEPIELVAYAPGRTREEAEDALASLAAELAIDLGSGPRVSVEAEPRGTSRAGVLAERAIARYSRTRGTGPFADVPKVTVGVFGQLKYCRLNHMLARRETGLPTGPPDFVGVGVHKGGTTWWAWLLNEHPEIWMERKEVHFFDTFPDLAPEECPVEKYHRLFPRPAGILAGEFTPGYMFQPWIAAQLHAAAPQARLLVLLRDPIERYRSGLTHGLRWGRPATGPVNRHHLGRGLYARQLERLYRYFPREQVLVLQYEKCVRDPASEFERTLRFIGVRDPTFAPERFDRPVNVTRRAKVEIDAKTYGRLVVAYRRDATRLPELAPGLELDLWPTLRA